MVAACERRFEFGDFFFGEQLRVVDAAVDAEEGQVGQGFVEGPF